MKQEKQRTSTPGRRAARAPARLACARLLVLHNVQQLVRHAQVLDLRLLSTPPAYAAPAASRRRTVLPRM
jgi:hypothetical protein